ncbi:hypothetical protein K7887_22615 (plasmid) [Sutcliffiella horikoshii]|uniref:hypothetical protein n=1 Tax=Sutcliffiella horikoshii TaxID=79883 RepID=UPI001CBCDA3D|nr:hypothetical protein [Sutcliffiella horikoshii]UAL49762.1 hypothetical protein K7887_22615 [Sutcliffiella horikoshii]
MQMDVYDLDSYIMSCSNLYTLKLFHDYGVNVSNFASPMVHINRYDEGHSLEIFVEGIKGVFQQIETYDYYQNNSEEFREMYDVSACELVIIITDLNLERAIKMNKTLISEMIDKSTGEFYEEVASINLLPSNKGISISVEFVGNFHELTEVMLELHKESLLLNEKLEVEMSENRNNDRLEEVA